MLLEARGVSKSFSEKAVLVDLTLGIEAGQHLVLVGSSGCGKSTLLRLFNGLIPPDAGHIHFRGSLVQPGHWAEIRRQMGYVLQEGGLFPHLSVADNLALVARNLGWKEFRIQRRQAQLLDLLRLPQSTLLCYPRQLSGGQRQRASLARALFLEPPLVLMDEPLGALDPVVRKELQDDLRALFVELGCGLIMVTHDMAEAAHFGHEIALLQQGRLACRGPYRQLLQSGCPPFLELLAAHRELPCY